MAFTFRAKLLASHFGLVVVVVLLAVYTLDRSLAADLRARQGARLEQQARGAAAWMSNTRHRERLAPRLAAVVDARVTIIAGDGRVVGDSEHPNQTEPGLDNQAGQPEFQAARERGVGRATRAEPGGPEMQLVAVPAGEGVVLRLAVPLASIEETVAAMRRRLLFAAVLAGAAALALGVLAARVIARPLRAMTESATRIAQGNYDIAVASTSPDDVGILSRSLASLASQLKARIGDLTAERDRLSAILSGMVEGVLVVGPDGKVLQANPSAHRILDLPRSPRGEALAEAVVSPGVRALIEESLDRGEVIEREVDALAVNVRPLASTAGRGVVVVLHDLARLRRLETVRRDFVANLSHELRTPVTAIQGYAETLLRGTADAPTQREFLGIVHRHAARIGRLVEDLLRLAHLEERPDGAVSTERVAVAAIAEHVLVTVQSRARPAGVEVAVAIAPSLTASADPAGLEQVLENLVDNAIKYGAGKVTIGGEQHEGRTAITVADDGPGIAPEHLPRLFERFYRVDASRSRELGGVGLGLAIVKHLVESMGGVVSVESVVGAGATFRVELPAG